MRPSSLFVVSLVLLPPFGAAPAWALGPGGSLANGVGGTVSAARAPGGRGTAILGRGPVQLDGGGLRTGGYRALDGRFSAGIGGCGTGRDTAAFGRCGPAGGAYGAYGAYGYGTFGRFAYGVDGYGYPARRDETVRVEPPGLPSASGIRPSPTLPPAIYVIGGGRPDARSRRPEARGTTSTEQLPGGARIVTIGPPAR